MLFREDGIWVTQGERLQLLRMTSFGNSHDAIDRTLFEALLPSASKIAASVNEATYARGRFGDYFDPNDPNNDPMDIARDLAEAELQAEGLDLWSLDSAPPEDTEPLTTDNRHRLPIDMAANLAIMYATDFDMERSDLQRLEILNRIRGKVQQVLAILPPSQRIELITSKPGMDSRLDEVA